MALKAKIDKKSVERLKALLKGLAVPVDKATADQIGSEVIEQMKKLIAAGISPIKGLGRFPRYLNPKSYPGKRKAKSPVNLNLSGDFLRSLTSKSVRSASGYSTVIGYSGKDRNGVKNDLKEQGHREAINQPPRPTIPQANEQESFAVSIEKIITRIFKARINTILRRK